MSAPTVGRTVGEPSAPPPPVVAVRTPRRRSAGVPAAAITSLVAVTAAVAVVLALLVAPAVLAALGLLPAGLAPSGLVLLTAAVLAQKVRLRRRAGARALHRRRAEAARRGALAAVPRPRVVQPAAVALDDVRDRRREAAAAWAGAPRRRAVGE